MLIGAMLMLLMGYTASAENEKPCVLIEYNGHTIEPISPEYYPADPGKEYILVDINIENRGYDDGVYTNPWNFGLWVDNVKYSYDGTTSLLESIDEPELDTVTLEPGGKISGGLVFMIPEGAINWALSFHDSKKHKVEYNHINTNEES